MPDGDFFWNAWRTYTALFLQIMARRCEADHVDFSYATSAGARRPPSPLRVHLAPYDVADFKRPDFAVWLFSRNPVQIAAEVLRLYRTPDIHAFV